jgi:hypothetical protein
MVNKHRVKNFIVPRAGVATPAAGADLYVEATGTPNLGVGGFGIYSIVNTKGNHDAAILAGTATNTPNWQIIQRRDTSVDRLPLPNRPFLESPKVNATCTVSARGTAAALRNNSVWIIGEVDGNAGEVPVNSETEYIVNASLHGWKTDLYNGKNTPIKTGRFTTPDYSVSTVYTTEIIQRDHLLQNVAFDFNNQGWQQVVALCIDSQATATPDAANQAQTIAAIAALSVGARIVIGWTDDAQAITLDLDQDLLTTFDLLDTELTALGYAGALLIPYSRNTAANIAAGHIIAGNGLGAATEFAEVDLLTFLALDMKKAYYEEVPQEKERVNVGLDGGFDATTYSDRIIELSEGAGYGTEILQQYMDIQGHRMYLGNKAWQQNHVEFGNEVKADGFYDVYVIESCQERVASSGMPSVSPQVTIVALLNTTVGSATSNPYFGAANPQKAYLQTFLNAWIPSAGYPHTALAL